MKTKSKSAQNPFALTPKEKVARAMNSSDLSASTIRGAAVNHLWAASKLTPLQECLIAVKYAGRQERLSEALQKLVMMRNGKRSSKPTQRFVSLCKLALEEWSIDRCQHCNGRGTMPDKMTPRLLHTCPVCHGTGRYTQKFADRAQALNLPEAVFMKLWLRRYLAILDYLRKQDAAAGKTLSYAEMLLRDDG